jgi:hypothetical protein
MNLFVSAEVCSKGRMTCRSNGGLRLLQDLARCLRDCARTARLRGLREPVGREPAACASLGMQKANRACASARLAPISARARGLREPGWHLIYIDVYMYIFIYIALVTHSWHTPLLGPHIRLVTNSRHIYTYLYIYTYVLLLSPTDGIHVCWDPIFCLRRQGLPRPRMKMRSPELGAA